MCELTSKKPVLITKHKPSVNLPSPNTVLTYQVQPCVTKHKPCVLKLTKWKPCVKLPCTNPVSSYYAQT